MKSTIVTVLMACLAVFAVRSAAGAEGQTARPSTYRGWKTLELSNGLVEVQIAPEIGGRVIQYKLGNFEHFFVNDQLAGRRPPPSGLGPEGEWLNYGGEKLWPAPQGWDTADQWPGPPDAVLDGSPHRGRLIRTDDGAPAVELVSRKDPRSGIRFSRTVRLFEGSTRVHIDATMTNVDTRPRRWGIWSVMQHDASDRTGSGYEKNLKVYCPTNPRSRFPDGYQVMFGLANNRSFQPDPTQGMMRIHYQRRVGKLGMDSSAGWVATVNGSAGRVFVQQFTYFPNKKYPDNASVEIWLHGTGQYIVADKLEEMEDDPITCPYLIETELLSPFADLKPGEDYTFGYDWYAATVGGDYPVLDCTQVGVTCEPLAATQTEGRFLLGGRFGVFYRGTVGVAFFDDRGKPLGRAKSRRQVSPTEPLVLSKDPIAPLPPKGTRTIALEVYDSKGNLVGELARVALLGVLDQRRR